MLTPAKIKETFLAEVNSRNIRYQGFPAAVVPCAAGASAQLFAAGAGPLVDFWLCGFICRITGVAADLTLVVTVGYGGVVGANPPLVPVVTTFPITISAGIAALGTSESPSFMLPYPVRIPGGSRMAFTSAAITGTDTIDEFRVILATAVGS